MLTFIQSKQIHTAAINKIILSTTENGKSLAITCSSDKTINFFIIEQDFEIIKTLNMQDEVFSIFETKNQDNEIVYLATLGGGKIVAINKAFDCIFQIHSQCPQSIGRKMLCCSLDNPSRNDKYGNILILTDSSFIDLKVWCKNAGTSVNAPHSHFGNNQPNNYFANQPHFGRGGPHRKGYY